MDVILLEKVANLGNLGDRVKVRAGYGRNYLIPFNKAVMATAANVAEFEARRAELEAKANESLAAAKARAEQLAGVEGVVIKANAGDEGKLFGSVGVSDIARAVTEAGVEIERSEVRLPEQIRNVGEYDVNIQFHTDVVATVKVVVEAE